MRWQVVTYNLGFPGQYYLPATNTNYNYFRDYNPQTGRYLESDPIGLHGGSFSTYAYVDENPVSEIDPLGRCPMSQKDKRCQNLLNQINAASKAMSFRELDIVGNPLSLPLKGEGWTIQSHQKAWQQAQNRLNNAYKQWQNAGCDDDDLPPGVKGLLKMDVPEPSSGNQNNSSLSVQALLLAIIASLQSATPALEFGL